MVSVSVRHLFHKPMDEKIKTWTLRFPAKENPNMEKALFDWPIVSQYDVKAKDPLISRKFSGMKFFYSSIRLTNQKPTLLAEAFPLCFSALYCHSLRSFGCSRFVLVVSVPRKRPLQTAVWDSW